MWPVSRWIAVAKTRSDRRLDRPPTGASHPVVWKWPNMVKKLLKEAWDDLDETLYTYLVVSKQHFQELGVQVLGTWRWGLGKRVPSS